MRLSIATTQLCHCSMKAAMDNMQMNKPGPIQVKLYLFTDTEYIFHTIFISQNINLLLLFSTT